MCCVRLVHVVCFAVLAVGSSVAISTTAKNSRSYSDRVQLFLRPTDSPVLFEGRILTVDSNPLPCTEMNSANGGEVIGRLLAPADQIAQVKAMLDAVLR